MIDIIWTLNPTSREVVNFNHTCLSDNISYTIRTYRSYTNKKSRDLRAIFCTTVRAPPETKLV